MSHASHAHAADASYHMHQNSAPYSQDSMYYNTAMTRSLSTSILPHSSSGYSLASDERTFEPVTDVAAIPHNTNGFNSVGHVDATGDLPLKSLTTNLPQTYAHIDPDYRYETSQNPRRVLTKPSKGVLNNGYDNADSDYILYVNDTLGGKNGTDVYVILDILGQGTFGQVVKCRNPATGEEVAVKVIKNKPAYLQQSHIEIEILNRINNEHDRDDLHHMIRLKDHFTHQSHLCLVFELLSSNLYEIIKQNQFRGLTTSLVRVFTEQLLDALKTLREANIIHCDLKPENILLKTLRRPAIKVIDFGSACSTTSTVYTYIQSRFYRSPEVILNYPYNTSIDMWSLGCICVELFLGLPIFPGTSEYNQITRITEMLGMPPEHMLKIGKQTGNYFNCTPDATGKPVYTLKPLDQYSAERNTSEQRSKKYFEATTLHDIIDQYPINRKDMREPDLQKESANRVVFIDFVRGLLELDPEKRWTPAQALQHPFITQKEYTGPFVPEPEVDAAAHLPVPAPALGPPTHGTPARRANGLGTYAQNAIYAQQQYNMMAQQKQNQNWYMQQQQQQHYAQAAAMASGSMGYPPPPMSQYMYSPTSSVNGPLMRRASIGSNGSAHVVHPSVAGTPGHVASAHPPSYAINSRIRSSSNAAPPGGIQNITQGTNNLGLGFSALPGGTNNTNASITPVLRRDDQWQVWDRRLDAHGPGGVQRRLSVSTHYAPLTLFQEQVEANSWNSPRRVSKVPLYPSPAGYYNQPPPGQQAQQPLSVVVDPNSNGEVVTAPPQVYSGYSAPILPEDAPPPAHTLPHSQSTQSLPRSYASQQQPYPPMINPPPYAIVQQHYGAPAYAHNAAPEMYYHHSNPPPQGHQQRANAYPSSYYYPQPPQ